MTRRVAILFGGRSAEHEVSLVSARAILQHLDRSRFTPVLLGIDKQGRFQLQEEAQLAAPPSDLRTLALGDSQGEVILKPAPDQANLLPVGERSPRPDALGHIDVAFPILHGTFGEDGTVQGLLELAGIPYVGAGVLGSAVGMDKDAMKRLLRDAGLPIVDFVTVRQRDYDRDPAAIEARAASLGLPCFVKPANAGSSVGVRKVKSPGELLPAVAHALRFDHKVVIERAVNAREIELAVLGNDDPAVSVPGEIVVTHPDGFYSYEAKYIDATGSHPEIPAALSPAQTAEAQRLALAVFQALDCAGMARVDLFLDRDTHQFYVNEINTIPGFTAISMYPKLWEASGLSFRDLISRLLDLALARHHPRFF